LLWLQSTSTLFKGKLGNIVPRRAWLLEHRSSRAVVVVVAAGVDFGGLRGSHLVAAL